MVPPALSFWVCASEYDWMWDTANAMQLERSWHTRYHCWSATFTLS